MGGNQKGAKHVPRRVLIPKNICSCDYSKHAYANNLQVFLTCPKSSQTIITGAGEDNMYPGIKACGSALFYLAIAAGSAPHEVVNCNDSVPPLYLPDLPLTDSRDAGLTCTAPKSLVDGVEHLHQPKPTFIFFRRHAEKTRLPLSSLMQIH